MTEAENGLEAVQQAMCHRPDVIVLDGNMPIMDGWTTCQHIKALTTIPVVMLTVHAELPITCGRWPVARTPTSPSRLTRTSCWRP